VSERALKKWGEELNLAIVTLDLEKISDLLLLFGRFIDKIKT